MLAVFAALLKEAPGDFHVAEVWMDAPAPSEVLVKTVAAGLCHSDLHYSMGLLERPLPAVMGHEASGVVLAVGNRVDGVSPGDRVVACPPSCGVCVECARHRVHRCAGKAGLQREPGNPRLRLADGTVVHQASDMGTFADHFIVHESSVRLVPPSVPLEAAAMVGCAVVTGVGAVVNTAQVRPGSTVAVVGCGGIGLNVMQGAVLSGAEQIIAIDSVPEKLSMAMAFGATDALLFEREGAEAVVASVVDLTSGRGVDYSFEAVGRPETVSLCWELLGERGLATVAGVLPAAASLTLSGRGLFAEKRIQGCYMGSTQFSRDIPRLFEMYEEGWLKLDELVSATFGLDEVNAAYAQVAAGHLARGLIVFPESSERSNHEALAVAAGVPSEHVTQKEASGDILR